VRCSSSAHAYGENIDIGTWLVLAKGIGERGVFIANHVCGVGEVVVCAILPFPYLSLFNRGVSSSAVGVSDESRFEKPDEVRFVSRGFAMSGYVSRWVCYQNRP
jgi:hypothetical protein